MLKNKSPVWLKKYTLIKHLRSTIVGQRLHLGKPECWPDKNDSELVQLYSRVSGATDTRATCLTEAADRYHFWVIFGGSEKGVCLWFDREHLLSDLRKDQTLIVDQVQYMTPKELKDIQLNEIPFAKREQYTDEREVRVIRNYATEGPKKDGFDFSASSLKRIYLNPWLNEKAFKENKAEISAMLKGKYGRVEILQSKTLRHNGWIRAARDAAKKST